jgi:vacuolar-type H+-ATPase subunit F/Vma7
MSVTEFIGDEVSAAGYRLCGVKVHIADRSNALSLINQACKRASLVLIGSSTAACLDNAQLDQLLANIAPPVLVVPEIAGRQSVPDITTRIHKQLGMLE